jgi:hypothetical protein
MTVDEVGISCPYCGEWQTVLVDPQNIGVSYVEDCQVCCQPILLSPAEDESGAIGVDARREDEG